jgi:hypothetical protein
MHDWYYYEPEKDTPSINSANVLATMNKFKMMSPRYSNAVEGNVTRSTHGLITFVLLVRTLACTTADPLDIVL